VVPKINSRTYRVRPVEEVVDEMIYLRDVHGFRAVIFVDDILTIHHQRTEDMCKEMIRRKVDMVWWCMSRADTIVRQPQMADLMAEAGCVQVFLGLESGSERILKLYNKKSTADIGAQAVEKLRSLNIDTFGGFILGADDETYDDMMHTVKYACDIGLETAQFSLLTPYPGTDSYEELKHKIITFNWDLYDGAHALFKSKHMDIDELNAVVKEAYFKFYLRPSYIWKILRSPKRKTIQYLLKYVKNSRKRITEELYTQDPARIMYEPLPHLMEPMRMAVNQ
jgi:anaerobic magnesium-protoporphyrin IX monomethyl ester cyclase